MFAFIQLHLVTDFFERMNLLKEQIELLPKECTLAFLSTNFLQVSTFEKPKLSASTLLFRKQAEGELDSLQALLPDNLEIIFPIAKKVFLSIQKQDVCLLSGEEFFRQGQKFTFSEKTTKITEENLDTEAIHIHFNRKAFYYTFQEEQEAFCQNFANKCLAFVFLNTVEAYAGSVTQGQSFYIDEKGIQRAKLLEKDILLYNIEKQEERKLEEEKIEKYELLFKVLVFAIQEHVKSSGLSKIVIGLSGGMDSSLTAPLAVEALGAENVIGLLMPSDYSSDHSITDAKALADNLGIQSHIIPIKDSMKATLPLLTPLAKEHSASEYNTQLMEQNLQSRLRGVLIMAMANALPAYVLGTGNKSEESMGYCTLYGDTCAALFPIGDLYKTEVYELGRWYNAYKGKEIIPNNCFIKEPSAELAPNQKDKDSLPDYEKLDSYLEKLTKLTIRDDYHEIIHDFTREERDIILKKIQIAEFKRQQSAPSIKLSAVTFGKDWK